MNSKFYKTDLKENAIDDLEKLFKFLELAKQDKSYWKWVIIALHSSLYKFMLLALKNSDCSGVWEQAEKKKVKLIYKIDPFNSKNKVISFLKAFKWIQDTEKMSRYMNSKAFISTLEIDKAMGKLNTTLRNQFFHFKPTDWLIEIQLIKEIKQRTLPIIRFIIFESNTVTIEESQLLIIDKMLKRAK
ncbi:MAG: hypothetical protein GXP44_00225 [bacterium]|nr:hypothetical protein [bacterium]